MSFPSSQGVHVISTSTIKPQILLQESQDPCYLTPWDIPKLSTHYIQKGLLLTKPSSPSKNIVDHLKNSLSCALAQFFPLAGRLVTVKQADSQSYCVYLDCSDAQGAQFIHAATQFSIADIVSPIDVPPIVQSLFPLVPGTVNHDGHTLPLLIVQVTELTDGIFIACSVNHAVADGTTYWNFFNKWSEISRTHIKFETNYKTQFNVSASNPPIITKRWFLDNQGPIINLPFSHHEEFIDRSFASPPLRERMFHFSTESLKQLKARANSNQPNTTQNEISTFQALIALIWTSVTRARQTSLDQKTTCKLAINNRTRMRPKLSQNYLGNCVQIVSATSTVAEITSKASESSNSYGIRWAAWLLNRAVSEHSEEKVREWLEGWVKEPWVYKVGRSTDEHTLMVSGSHTFKMFGNDFGWGEVVAVRSGFGNKYDGKVMAYEGRESGSIDLEINLVGWAMSALETDEEFVKYVASPAPPGACNTLSIG
ncbi:hypothetical protein Syun_004307 [Stephania yunnanensis]|uniref:HXXXD-type acyl-transferase family protein n=1 Tax=Stephania yunnanensis TaxID=152371 RepID=A0AAP0Q1B4_9MAGN